MRTINEEAKILYDDAKNIGAFINGVDFAQRWISIHEELPPNYKSILVRDNGGNPIRSTALYKDGIFYPDFKVISHFDITHWRPIDFV